jgi:hypothetical protein
MHILSYTHARDCLDLYVYTCMYACMHVCMYAYIYVYMYMYVYTYIRMIHTYICMYIYVYMYHTCIYPHTSTRVICRNQAWTIHHVARSHGAQSQWLVLCQKKKYIGDSSLMLHLSARAPMHMRARARARTHTRTYTTCSIHCTADRTTCTLSIKTHTWGQ